ncbi:uncharacterized protein E5676_scaffold231G00940 [Cucumis melo var. makuwa]|uniref:Envelope-like protein n=1 Tax=Cucumis melo var. makuwa TaxID=1194695 RepID=A0A5A7UIB7_CUCMM|nr:uncharacterized protein E6C27_scaffold222G001260 [Cucumis melo var. makuwa]TYK10913.1 uncharacterized protein E5676_scaffold231G00940 [Cucumis melo var. makuwa]
MVNTQKGNYQARSSKAIDEALESRTNMHGVRMRHIADSAAEDVETAPGVFESHVSKMDLDERDDVSLARLLKKGHPSAINEEVGRSGRSLPVRSYVRFDSSVDDQHSVSDPDPIGDSTSSLGENIADPSNENLDTNVDDYSEPTDNCAPDNV